MEYLNVDEKCYYKMRIPSFGYPSLIGYMSVDGNRQYHSDLTQLKFLNKIPDGRCHLDLNHNIDNAVKRTTDDDEANEKMSLLLKFLLDKVQYLHLSNINISIKNAPIICYRRTLITVMCSPFITNYSWRIIGTLFRGSVYLCILETPQERQKRLTKSERERELCAWGYKFEQYLLSDTPHEKPNIQRPVIENEEFSLICETYLDHHRLIYGAQIDGCLPNSDASSLPDNSDFQTTLDYLRKQTYVELKTNRLIENYKQEKNYRRYKLLRCWCQCYLAGLKGLLVGFRDDSGIVRQLKWYETYELPNICQDEWNPKIAITVLESFLSFVKNCFNQCICAQYGSYVDITKIDPITLHFELGPNKKICVTDNYDPYKDSILPQWFMDNFDAK